MLVYGHIDLMYKSWNNLKKDRESLVAAERSPDKICGIDFDLPLSRLRHSYLPAFIMFPVSTIQVYKGRQQIITLSQPETRKYATVATLGDEEGTRADADVFQVDEAGARALSHETRRPHSFCSLNGSSHLAIMPRRNSANILNCVKIRSSIKTRGVLKDEDLANGWSYHGETSAEGIEERRRRTMLQFTQRECFNWR